MKNKIIRKVRLLGDTLAAALLNQLEWLSSRLYNHANTHRPPLPAKNGAVMVTGATARLLSESASSSGRLKQHALDRVSDTHNDLNPNIKGAAKPAAAKIADTSPDETASMKNVVHYENYFSTGSAASVDDSSPEQFEEQPRQERRQQTERRNYSSKTMWLCLTSPRRTQGRRRSDRRFPIQDVFSQGALILAALLMVLSLTDAFLTLNILARGGTEVNPVMNYMLGFGTFAFVASKMLMTAIPVAALTAAGNLVIFNLIRVRTMTAVLIGMYCALIMYELILLSS